MNRTTGAQRYNKKMDAIFEIHKKQQMEMPKIKVIEHNNEIEIFLPIDMNIHEYANALKALGRMTTYEAITTFGLNQIFTAAIKAQGKEKIIQLINKLTEGK